MNWFRKENHQYADYRNLPAHYHPDWSAVYNHELRVLTQEEANCGRVPYYDYHRSGIEAVAKTNATEIINYLKANNMRLVDLY